VFVLQKIGTYKSRDFDELLWHDTSTKFHKDCIRHSSTIKFFYTDNFVLQIDVISEVRRRDGLMCDVIYIHIYIFSKDPCWRLDNSKIITSI
jgi:hypothetical protein